MSNLTTCNNIKQWITEAGFPASIMKIDALDDSWYNGYVGIPPTHLLHGKHYNEYMPDGITLPEDEPIGKRNIITVFCGIDSNHPKIDGYFNVHGGITYTGTMKDDTNNMWWIGFDCHHYEDNIDKCNAYYVEAECEYLAKQLKEVDKV